MHFNETEGNDEDAWVDAVSPSGATCENAGCADKFQNLAGDFILYDESFQMRDDTGRTCVKFRKTEARLDDETCSDTKRPICSCESEDNFSQVVFVRQMHPLSHKI